MRFALTVVACILFTGVTAFAGDEVLEAPGLNGALQKGGGMYQKGLSPAQKGMNAYQKGMKPLQKPGQKACAPVQKPMQKAYQK